MEVCANYGFDAIADRSGMGNMKYALLESQSNADLMLGGAEFDFATVPVIREALSEFSSRGLYGFTLADDVYLSAVCHWLERVRHLSVEPIDIVPAYGVIYGLATAIRTFTKRGEGVIVQHPAYYRFDRTIVKNGRKVIDNPLTEIDGVYSVDFRDLENKMSVPENSLMVLCNPHNPTGRIFSHNELNRIAELAHAYNVIVYSDEIFGEISMLGHEAISYASVDPKNSIVATSLGKVFSFTGVNHANLIIKDGSIRELYMNQRDEEHFGSIDPFFYSALIAGYSEEGFVWVESLIQYVKNNHELLGEEFSKRMPQLRLSPLEGTYVAWIDCRQLGLDSKALDEFFIKEAGTIVDPGWMYGNGGNGFIRINIATPISQIGIFIDRLHTAYMKRGFGKE
jgi:cystathionine beta-lyase